MKQYLIYSTDSQLSFNSYSLIAVCDSKAIAVSLIMPELIKYSQENFKSEGYDTSKQQLDDLVYSINNINQTQSMDTNYVIEEVEVNKMF